MKRYLAPASLFSIPLVWLLAGLGGGLPAAGKAVSLNADGPSTAVLDITRVFQHYGRFADRFNKANKVVSDAEELMRARRADYEAQVNKLDRLGAATEERQRMEEDLKRVAAEIAVDVDLKKKAFRQQETTIYIESLDEIQAAVKSYAVEHGIKLVLRISGAPIKRDDSDDVLKALNRSVIFYSEIDITDDILALLNGNIERK